MFKHRPGRCATALLLLAVLAACGGGQDSAPTSNADLAQAEALGYGKDGRNLPTCTAAPQTLYDISAVQGSGALSPLVGQAVTVRGVVTGDFQASNQLNGFFIQQPIPDRDKATSEGIFVFAPTRATPVAVGQYVQVSGTVTEFKSGNTEPARLTQISSLLSVEVCGTTTAIRPTRLDLPVAGPEELESLEGMLVSNKDPLYVTEVFGLGRFGELVLSAKDRLFHPNNQDRLTPDQARALNARSRIILDDGLSVQNPNPIPNLSAPDTSGTRRLGDVAREVQGVLSWGFDAYRIQPTAATVFRPKNERPAAPQRVGGDLRVASLNVLNYFSTLNSRGANNAAEQQRQRDKLVEAIVGLDADVLGLIEIENNQGEAMTQLLDAVNTRLGGPVYRFNSSGVPGTDVIKVAIAYKSARVRPVGSPVVPTDPDFVVDGGLRPPVAQRFASVSNGGGFWYVVSHLKSKGSCPTVLGGPDDDLGQGCWNASRTRQVGALNRWVADLTAQSGEQDVLMMGDFNAYLNEDPIKAVEAAGFDNLVRRIDKDERYSFVFQGESGLLDYAFASDSLRRQVSGASIWHINADEPPVLDYNTEFKTDDRYAPTAFRSSDHDPVLVGLRLRADAPAQAPLLEAVLPTSAQAGTPTVISGISAVLGAAGVQATLTVDWGDGSAPELLPLTATSASHVYTASGSFALRISLVQADNPQPAELAATLGVRPAPPPVDPSTLPELFFSEYIEGSGFNKALEIYNPTTATVDLSAYSIRLYSNGAGTPTSSLVLAGSLAPGAVFVACNPSMTVTTACTTLSAVINHNGDDAYTLEKAGAVVDAFGQVGFDPGASWGVAGSGLVTADATLRRLPSIMRGSSPPAAPAVWDLSGQWLGFANNTLDGLGRR